jgi:hypothetical protein
MPYKTGRDLIMAGEQLVWVPKYKWRKTKETHHR